MNTAAALAMGTSWEPCLVGATIRNTYPGMTAQTAFTVKMLIECGFTGYEGALAETYGEILGEQFDPAILIDGLGERYTIRDSYFKFNAACALTHPVLDALADALDIPLRSGHYPPLDAATTLDPDLVSQVRVRVAERSKRLDIQAEQNQLSAKFSIPYAVATYLVHGNSTPDSFRGDALQDRRVIALSERVEVIGDSSISARWPVEAAAEVAIDLRDGRVLSGTCANPFGSTPGSATVDDLRSKFQFLTQGPLSTVTSDTIWQTALSLEHLEDMSKFPLATT
jgi:2-methylcitrate dehydratase PrpD